MAVLTLACSVQVRVPLFCVQAPKPAKTVPQFFVERPKHFNDLNHVSLLLQMGTLRSREEPAGQSS